MIDSVSDVLSILGIITLLAGAYLVVRSRATTTTVETQKELIGTLVICKDQQAEKILSLENSVAKLEGKLEVIKDIPLKEINAALAQIDCKQDKLMGLLPEQEGV